LIELVDIAALAELAHSHGAWLAVDNCFCTPALQQPLKLGADIVIHSATKYIDGQGRCLGGAVAGRAQQMQEVVGFLRTAGPTLSAFNAWVMLKGLETLSIRMQAQSARAFELAHWLTQQVGIERVYYAGLKDHPQHQLAKRQQSAFGAVLSFTVKGSRDEAWRFIDATKMISITTNLGDTKTTIAHPGSTSHGRLSAEERTHAGVTDNLIRLAVGLEDVKDLKADLLLGLAALG